VGKNKVSVPTDTTSAIPAQFDIPENVAQEVCDWLVAELENAKMERDELTQNLVRWERLYEAKPAQKVKTFPWDGASNLEVPTIGGSVDAVHARIMNTVFGARDLWSAVVKAPEWTSVAPDIGRWLNWVGREVLHIRPVIARWLLSTIKFGTGILKEKWVRRQKKVKIKNKAGGIDSGTVDVHNGPMLTSVPLADFFLSNDALYSGDIQNCEWVGERQLYTFKQLKALEISEGYQNVDKIQSSQRSQASDLEEEIDDSVGVSISEFKDYEVWEFHCSRDIDEDGILEELRVVLHAETRTPLKVEFNPYYHQERPYTVARYMIRDNSFYGMGMCQMLDPIQTEVSSIHNRRLDNATLANTVTFSRVRGGKVGPMSWYPGMIFDVGAQGDLEAMRIGQTHPTLLPEEMNTNAIGERRTGVNDYSLGRESAAIGSRATATSTVALLKESNVKFGSVINEIREVISAVGHQTIALYQQNGLDARIYYEMFEKKNAAAIRKYLTLPEGLSRAGVLLDVPAISEVYNKDIERQTFLTLMQITQQFYGGMMQAFNVAVSPNPQIPPQLRQLATQGAIAASKLWERTLKAFDIVDASTFTPDVEKMLGVQEIGAQLNGQTGAIENTQGGEGFSVLESPPGSTGGETSGGSVQIGMEPQGAL